MSLRINRNGIIEIDNVIAVEQFGEVQYYTTTISVREIGSVFDRLTYDGEAQRGRIDGKAEIDKSHVKSIYEAFINGNSIRGHLTWNLRDSDDSDFEYYNNKLIIGNQLITIPDSAHRHEALKMISENVNDDSLLDSRFTLDIYNLDFSEEKSFFATVNGKVKPPSNNRILYLSDSIESRLLRDVIKKSKLDGKIEVIRNSASRNGMITKFSTLYDSLFSEATGVYGLGFITEENYDEYLDWLSKFYSELLDSREEFSKLNKKDKNKSKKDDMLMLLEEISWWGYALLSKELKGRGKWRVNLRNMMNKKILCDGVSVDVFHKLLPFWQNTVIKPSYDFFNKRPKEGVSTRNDNTSRNLVKKVFKEHIIQG